MGVREQVGVREQLQSSRSQEVLVLQLLRAWQELSRLWGGAQYPDWMFPAGAGHLVGQVFERWWGALVGNWWGALVGSAGGEH